MSDGSKVYYLNYHSPKTEQHGIIFSSCKLCRNKTFTMVYADDADTFPVVKCACCSAILGRVGWVPEEPDPPPKKPIEATVSELKLKD